MIRQIHSTRSWFACGCMLLLLLAGCGVRLLEPAAGQRRGWVVVAVVALCLVEAALIGALLLSLASWRRAEERARDLSTRLIHAQEQERARLARELHDDITQRLARLAIDAGRLEQAAGEVVASERTRLMRVELVRLSEDVHALSYRLHPSLLEDLGLSAALRAECERFAERESIPAAVKLTDVPERMPPDAALGLFRVLQESLRNVARHARASTVEVSLRGLDGGLQLAVRDDGIGFDHHGTRNHPTLGIASMRERLRLLAGELEIDTEPGHGTTILAWVPLKKGAT